ncbi:MAG: glycoside hydrolase family protein [Sulfurimonas sp.]|nr:glycoside hydrolase family protein [Sulfurimonas sp.]
MKYADGTGFVITVALAKAGAKSAEQTINVKVTQDTSKSKPKPKVLKNTPKKTSNTVNSQKQNSYYRRRDEKLDNKRDSQRAKENEAQTKKLDDIFKAIKNGGAGGSSKGGLFGGSGGSIGRMFKMGAVGGVVGSIFSGGIKGLFKKLGIVGAIYSVVDNFSEEIEKFKQNIGKDNLSLTDKIMFVGKRLGDGFVEMLNAFGAEIDPSVTNDMVTSIRGGIKKNFDNFKVTFPTFGSALESIFTVTDDVLGKATDMVNEGLGKIKDHTEEAFRDKDKIEQEYIKAKQKRQDTQEIYENSVTKTVPEALGFGDHKARRKIAKDAFEKAQLAEEMARKEVLKSSTTAKDSKGYHAVVEAQRQAVQSRNAPKMQEMNNIMDRATEVDKLIIAQKTAQLALKSTMEKDPKHAKVLSEALKRSIKEEEGLQKELKALTIELSKITLEGTKTSNTVPSVNGKLWKKGTMEYEGFEPKIYKDSKGYDTIGYGHKLTKEDKRTGRFKNGITKKKAKALFEQDKAKHDKDLYAKFPWIKDQPAPVRNALEDMSYNMGVGGNNGKGLSGFTTTLKHIKAGNYKKASVSMLKSKYASDVGQRAIDNSTRIASASGDTFSPATASTESPMLAKVVEKLEEINMNTKTKKTNTQKGGDVKISVNIPLQSINQNIGSEV